MKWIEFKNRKLHFLTKCQYGFLGASFWLLAVTTNPLLQAAWACVATYTCYTAVYQTIVDLVIE